MRDEILSDKALAFAIRIVNLNKYLVKNKEYTISNQIVRSGTSIGANISEANYAQSKSDFISKLHIALKETSETAYWLTLLYKTEYLTSKMYQSMYDDCIEIKKILVKTINTAKSNE